MDEYEILRYDGNARRWRVSARLPVGARGALGALEAAVPDPGEDERFLVRNGSDGSVTEFQYTQRPRFDRP